MQEDSQYRFRRAKCKWLPCCAICCDFAPEPAPQETFERNNVLEAAEDNRVRAFSPTPSEARFAESQEYRAYHGRGSRTFEELPLNVPHPHVNLRDIEPLACGSTDIHKEWSLDSINEDPSCPVDFDIVKVQKDRSLSSTSGPNERRFNVPKLDPLMSNMKRNTPDNSHGRDVLTHNVPAPELKAAWSSEKPASSDLSDQCQNENKDNTRNIDESAGKADSLLSPTASNDVQSQQNEKVKFNRFKLPPIFRKEPELDADGNPIESEKKQKKREKRQARKEKKEMKRQERDAKKQEKKEKKETEKEEKELERQDKKEKKVLLKQAKKEEEANKEEKKANKEEKKANKEERQANEEKKANKEEKKKAKREEGQANKEEKKKAKREERQANKEEKKANKEEKKKAKREERQANKEETDATKPVESKHDLDTELGAIQERLAIIKKESEHLHSLLGGQRKLTNDEISDMFCVQKQTQSTRQVGAVCDSSGAVAGTSGAVAGTSGARKDADSHTSQSNTSKSADDEDTSSVRTAGTESPEKATQLGSEEVVEVKKKKKGIIRKMFSKIKKKSKRKKVDAVSDVTVDKRETESQNQTEIENLKAETSSQKTHGGEHGLDVTLAAGHVDGAWGNTRRYSEMLTAGSSDEEKSEGSTASEGYTPGMTGTPTSHFSLPGSVGEEIINSPTPQAWGGARPKPDIRFWLRVLTVFFQ